MCLVEWALSFGLGRKLNLCLACASFLRTGIAEAVDWLFLRVQNSRQYVCLCLNNADVVSEQFDATDSTYKVDFYTRSGTAFRQT